MDKSYQSGYMYLIIIPIIMAILIAFAIISIHEQKEFNTKYNSWTAQCIEDGGVVMTTSMTLHSVNFECIKDGRIINHID